MAHDLYSFIGQRHIVNEMAIHIGAALTHNRPLEHVVLYGPPGLGKTTLAELIYKEVGWRFIQKTGKELTKKVLWEILENMEFRDIFFLDEIHRSPADVLEILYGPLQTINNLNLKSSEGETYEFEGAEMCRFTLIGGTTSAGMLPRPLRDRFVHQFALQHYKIGELIEILAQNQCPLPAAQIIAERSRRTPRIALNYLTKVRNRAKNISNIRPEHCHKMFKVQSIDKIGLGIQDKKILDYLKGNGTTGIEELSYASDIDKTEIIDMHEPYLMQLGFVKRTSRGREITNKGLKYLGNRK